MSKKYLLRENNSIGCVAAHVTRGYKYVLHIVVKPGGYLKHTRKK